MHSSPVAYFFFKDSVSPCLHNETHRIKYAYILNLIIIFLQIIDDEDEDEEYEEDEEEEEEEEEGEDEAEEEGLFFSDQSPGQVSGCTAVLTLIQDKQIIVANVGDSRCVLSRKGKAVDLSEDHKPENSPERERIVAVGGKVTAEGRVNGGLNLSRALGDHSYKRNKEKSDKEQMIIALPEIMTETLQEDDEFMVLACDGIWNAMTSQEVVEFVREKMNKPPLSRVSIQNL